MPKKSIKQILDEHIEVWMSIPGIIGAGTSKIKGKPCILLLADKKHASLKKKIPSQIQGFKIQIEKVGKIKAMNGG